MKLSTILTAALTTTAHALATPVRNELANGTGYTPVVPSPVAPLPFTVPRPELDVAGVKSNGNGSNNDNSNVVDNGNKNDGGDQASAKRNPLPAPAPSTLPKPRPGQHITPADIERLALPYAQLAYVIGDDATPFCEVIKGLATLERFEFDVRDFNKDCWGIFRGLRDGAVREEEEMEEGEAEEAREAEVERLKKEIERVVKEMEVSVEKSGLGRF